LKEGDEGIPFYTLPAAGMHDDGRKLLAGSGSGGSVLFLLRGQRWSCDGTASRRGGAGAARRGKSSWRPRLGGAGDGPGESTGERGGAQRTAPLVGGGREARHAAGARDRGLERFLAALQRFLAAGCWASDGKAGAALCGCCPAVAKDWRAEERRAKIGAVRLGVRVW